MTTRQEVYSVLDTQPYLLEDGKASLKEALGAIDTERDYQDWRWNASTTVTEGRHSVGEFLVFMDDYVREAKAQLSAGDDLALHTIRKVAGLGVACMEQHGAPEPDIFEQQPILTGQGADSLLELVEDGLRDAKTLISRNGEPTASRLALGKLREVTNLCVACMQQHGAPQRMAPGA